MMRKFVSNTASRKLGLLRHLAAASHSRFLSSTPVLDLNPSMPSANSPAAPPLSLDTINPKVFFFHLPSRIYCVIAFSLRKHGSKGF